MQIGSSIIVTCRFSPIRNAVLQKLRPWALVDFGLVSRDIGLPLEVVETEALAVTQALRNLV
ncbi:hypothetical protein PanWU01x14_046240 [Parasponia andersonii]|uniref:Uncharacterized protein n=1 Tax=Parasponia andersonii TaxID=3476 RepID=A0A2P5DNN1_PARAD|nr:hypothetical protein PanWU01x14_046240 [Parasponia andersonii]